MKTVNSAGITKEKFESYVAVQNSGVTNMFDVKTVCDYSGLTKDECIDIMENYAAFAEQFRD